MNSITQASNFVNSAPLERVKKQRKGDDPNWVDISFDAISWNAWENTTQYWNNDRNDNVDLWALQKVFRVMCSMSHFVVNQNESMPAIVLFDSSMFSRLAERWTSREVGGSIRIVEKRISIGWFGVKDKEFVEWAKLADERAKRRKKRISNSVKKDHQ